VVVFNVDHLEKHFTNLQADELDFEQCRLKVNAECPRRQRCAKDDGLATSAPALPVSNQRQPSCVHVLLQILVAPCQFSQHPEHPYESKFQILQGLAVGDRELDPGSLLQPCCHRRR